MSQSKELAAFLNKMGASIKFRIEESLGNGYVRLNVDESQRRQAKHDIRSVEDIVIELVRNSRDAGAKNIFVASRRRDDLREIWVIDDGCGIPPELFSTVFEARVTSKVEKVLEDDYGIHGRGMALFAIKSRCREAIVRKSVKDGLTVLKITVDTATLPEKADQSTFPTIKKSPEGYELSGPRNIPRIMAEMAHKHQSIDFYFGLPSQIAGVLTRTAKQNSMFADFRSENLIDFQKTFCDYFGFELSERNSYRCMSGELKTVNIRELLSGKANPALKEKGLSSLIDKEDLDILLNKTQMTLEELAEKYNLCVKDKQLSKKGNIIKLILSLEKAEDI